MLDKIVIKPNLLQIGWCRWAGRPWQLIFSGCRTGCENGYGNDKCGSVTVTVHKKYAVTGYFSFRFDSTHCIFLLIYRKKKKRKEKHVLIEKSLTNKSVMQQKCESYRNISIAWGMKFHAGKTIVVAKKVKQSTGECAHGAFSGPARWNPSPAQKSESTQSRHVYTRYPWPKPTNGLVLFVHIGQRPSN